MKECLYGSQWSGSDEMFEKSEIRYYNIEKFLRTDLIRSRECEIVINMQRKECGINAQRKMRRRMRWQW